LVFRFKRATCVAVGTFNIYVIQPAWLAEIGIIPKSTQVEIYSDLTEPGFRFTSSKLNSRWVITPNRIHVETDDPNKDCGVEMAKVLGHLPWTPLVALGNNTTYLAPRDEIAGLPLIAAIDPPVPEGFDFVQKTVHLGLRQGETLFNLQVAATEEELELSCNAHTELKGRSSDFAQESAMRFFEVRKTAQSLITALFQASVTNVSDND
jgi:hypothetical protein